MQLCTQTFTFPFPFPAHVYAVLNKYPNPLAPHVISIDVLDRSFLEDGTIRSERLLGVRQDSPKWVSRVSSHLSSRSLRTWLGTGAELNDAPPTAARDTRCNLRTRSFLCRPLLSSLRSHDDDFLRSRHSRSFHFLNKLSSRTTKTPDGVHESHLSAHHAMPGSDILPPASLAGFSVPSPDLRLLLLLRPPTFPSPPPHRNPLFPVRPNLFDWTVRCNSVPAAWDFPQVAPRTLELSTGEIRTPESSWAEGGELGRG